MKMTTEQFISEVLAAAQESGISDAEVYYHQSSSMRVLVSKGEIDEYALHDAGGLSLRGLVDSKIGMSYTEALDRDAIVMLVRGVLESATLISDMDEQFIYAGSPAYREVCTQGRLGTPDERIAFALSLDRYGRETTPLVQELGYVNVQTRHASVRIVNTHGLDLSHESDLCYGFVQAIARKGDRVSTGDGLSVGLSLSDLDAHETALEAVGEAVLQLDAAPCDSGEMPVIIRNTAMGDLCGAFLGVFSAEAAQKGLSLLAGKEGTPIASSSFSLIDDPLLPGGIFSRPFDAEGVATYTKPIIRDGMLHTLLHNLKTAKKAGVSSTGNAARSGYAGPVGISPFNLIIPPGEKDLAALEAEMGNGLVITGIEGLHAGTNAVSGDFSLLARGYLVRQGTRAQPVEQVTVAGNFYELLSRIETIGNDVRVQVSPLRSPSVLIGRLSIAGR